MTARCVSVNLWSAPPLQVTCVVAPVLTVGMLRHRPEYLFTNW